jgi:hypothetical protein
VSGADRLEDGYPHGTVEGFDRGCRSGYCPAGNEHGLSCKRAKRLAAGDYRYSRLVKRGMTPGEIADELGLVPETHEAPKRARDDAEGEVVEQQTSRPEPTPDDEKRRRAEIRAWAREHNIPVGEKGRIAHAVVIGWLNDDPTLGGTRTPEAQQAILTAIVHAPVVPDMETRAELFNEGFDTAREHFEPLVADLIRDRDAAEASLALVLAKWGTERQRRMDAEQLVFALSGEISATGRRTL